VLHQNGNRFFFSSQIRLGSLVDDTVTFRGCTTGEGREAQWKDPPGRFYPLGLRGRPISLLLTFNRKILQHHKDLLQRKLGNFL
jgi:hypothetical protein